MNIEPATIESGNNITLHKTLDIRLLEISDNHAIAEVTIGDKHLNTYDGAHGGVIASLIDVVSFYPRPLLPSGLACTTSSMNMNFIRPVARGETLTARAELMHLGKRTAMLTVTVNNSKGKLVAHGTTTLMILSHKV